MQRSPPKIYFYLIQRQGKQPVEVFPAFQLGSKGALTLQGSCGHQLSPYHLGFQAIVAEMEFIEKIELGLREVELQGDFAQLEPVCDFVQLEPKMSSPAFHVPTEEKIELGLQEVELQGKFAQLEPICDFVQLEPKMSSPAFHVPTEEKNELGLQEVELQGELAQLESICDFYQLEPKMSLPPFHVPTEEKNEEINNPHGGKQVQNPSDHLAIEIKNEINNLSSPVSFERCIYRVPESLARSNMDAYKPRLVPIGPFHHDPHKFKDIEKQKLRYLHAFLQRTGLSLDTCIEDVRKLEGKARSSFAETIELSSNDLVKMLLVDACFIIELFLKLFADKKRDKSDLLISVPVLLNGLCNDLKLLENQLPFFVLQGIYDLPQKPLSRSLRELTFLFFEYHNVQSKEPNFEIKHFTDLLRTFLLPKKEGKGTFLLPKLPLKEGDGVKFNSVPSATELDEAGAKFEKGLSTQCFLDIRFENGRILRIPPFLVESGTEAFIRNIVAYEQCHCDSDEFYISSYLALIAGLVKTRKDVNLLVENGILVNWIGDNEAVSRLFHNVGHTVVTSPSKFHYRQLHNDLNAHCRKPWSRLQASLKRDYFKTPWMSAATVAAIFLLLLTCAQTISSIIPLT
ncbi:Protein of unknown function DUF247, plant [Dillenia turbinata]|uniref:Uncharacterized protein n=1 Tax=Dillenia turbinata TaxID=194707 RepID=A0AAN8VCB4_9MAGN